MKWWALIHIPELALTKCENNPRHKLCSQQLTLNSTENYWSIKNCLNKNSQYLLSRSMCQALYKAFYMHYLI